jgi:hypothetical protein
MKIFTELSCLNASSASLKGESTDGKICSRVLTISRSGYFFHFISIQTNILTQILRLQKTDRSSSHFNHLQHLNTNYEMLKHRVGKKSELNFESADPRPKP